MIKIIDPFTNIEVSPLPDENETGDYFANSIQIGNGAKMLRVDPSGIWLGAEKFADAPFSVDMDGNIIATTLALSSISGSLDDINDGTTFKRVIANEKTGAGYAFGGLNSNFEIIKGFVNTQLASKTLPTNGVRIDSNGIYGRKSGVTKFYINTVGDAYFAGTIAASSITGTTITGGKIQTSNSAYVGIKITDGTFGYTAGIVVFGQSIELRDVTNVLYGTIGGASGYFNITTSSSRNILINTGVGSTFIAGAAIAPNTSGGSSCGLSSQYWSNVYSNNYTLSSGAYINYTGGFIQSNSQFRVVGSINLTGNMTFENYASLTIKDSGGVSRTLTVKYDSTLAKYILST